MKFLKLLNPWETQEGSGLSVGDQQRVACRRFPELVQASRLNYWTPGNPIETDGIRYLLGLAASYDLSDLRLCDIINDRLSKWNPRDVRVDVFNAAACQSRDEFALYFKLIPNIQPGWHFTPLAGKWIDGNQVASKSGFEARRFILEELGCDITAEESVSGLCPPDPRLMED